MSGKTNERCAANVIGRSTSISLGLVIQLVTLLCAGFVGWLTLWMQISNLDKKIDIHIQSSNGHGIVAKREA